MEQTNITSAFISFRSPTYDYLKSTNCEITHGGRCDKLKANKCSNRLCSFRRASVFLHRQDFDCVILPPEYILPQNTILTVSSFLKLCPSLDKIISQKNCFIRFEIPKEQDSFWTEMEMDFWRKTCFKKKYNEVYYSISLNKEEKTEVIENRFEPIAENEILLYDRVSRSLDILSQPKHSINYLGYYTDCYVQECPCCGKIFLLSPKAIEYLTNHKDVIIYCPLCNKGTFSYNRKYSYIIFSYEGNINTKRDGIKPIEILQIAVDSNKHSPLYHPLICFNDESFSSYGIIKSLFEKNTHLVVRNS